MIGLFDSGLGGLTVLRRLRDAVPSADLLFFADQAHAPYGDRDPADLMQLLRHNLEWLDGYGVDAIVMACNTSCAIADKFGWPPVRAHVLDLIDAAAEAVRRAGVNRIGVVATAATARSGAYARAIVGRLPTARVVEVAAPALVPLVEAGVLVGERPRTAVRDVCELLPRDVEAVILACTHYPLLDDHFASALGSQVLRIDPALIQAERAAELLSRLEAPAETGTIECVTTGDPRFFEQNVRTIGGVPARVRHASESSYFEGISKASAVPET